MNRKSWFLDTSVTIRVSFEDGSNNISVLEHLARQGDSPPLHTHEAEDEIFHILEGECLVHVDGKERVGESGDILIAQRGKPHTYRVESETARFLTITGGRDFERLVRSVGRPAEGEGGLKSRVLRHPSRLRRWRPPASNSVSHLSGRR